MHQYTFPANSNRHIILDLAHGYGGPELVTSATLSIQGNDIVSGGRTVAGWANGRVIYFAMKFSRPFQGAEVQVDGKPWAGDPRFVQGKEIKCAFHYDADAGERLLVKTGISAVSAENA